MLKQPAAFGTSNNPSPSANICEAALLIPCANTPSLHMPVGTHSICKCCLADAFLALVKEKYLDPIPPVMPSDSLDPLISLGPSTDAILDQFSLGDDLLSCLHILTRIVCSSHWEGGFESHTVEDDI